MNLKKLRRLYSEERLQVRRRKGRKLSHAEYLDVAERLASYRRRVSKVVGRLVDVLPIAQDHYYHSAMHGSWSIKAILPTIASDLGYTSLVGVKDGRMAQQCRS